MCYVKATGERFRSFEADHKKAYQELVEKKLLEQFKQTVLVVIFLTPSSVICINKHVLNFANTRYKIQDTFICHKITHTHIYLHY